MNGAKSLSPPLVSGTNFHIQLWVSLFKKKRLALASASNLDFLVRKELGKRKFHKMKIIIDSAAIKHHLI